LPTGIAVKPCFYLCGFVNNDEDPIEKGSRLKWRYPTGKGTACAHCLRIWYGKVAHKGIDAQEYQDMVRSDRNELDMHHQWLESYYKRKIEGKKQAFDRSDCKKKTLKRRQRQGVQLFNDSDYLPIEEYVERFGDPNDPKNKRRGHKVIRVAGKKGVAFPREKGVPMTLRQYDVAEDVQDDHIEDGDESDAASSEQVDSKYEHMKKEFQDSMRSAVGGWSFADLLNSCSKPDNSAEDDADVTEDLEPKAPPVKRRRLCATVSDEGDALPRTTPSKRKAATTSSVAPAAKPHPHRTSAPKVPAAVASARASAAASSTAGSGGDAAPGGAATSTTASRGRKAITVEEYLEAQWPLWEAADEHTQFFNDRAEVTVRSVRRYIDKATVSYTQEKDPENKNRRSGWPRSAYRLLHI